ncbi:SRPBCC family protein [Streptomyces sp. NPDC017941]|uniref:SRPBCC family protein n=1 Tax=unclassified Streptomyces TaxID=2593676 RepID=UPI003794F382
MDWCHYRFRSVWNLPAGPAAVYGVLERAEDYARWWPQVREVATLGGHDGTARLRSLLPYDLVITATERHRDPGRGVLEISMTGDLEGWARWTVAAADGGSRATYDQEVDVRKPLMRRLAVPGRPLFLLNHALMMRAGRRGLAAYLRSGLNERRRDL